MSASTPTMDGDWRLEGLPPGYIISVFMLADIEGYVTGDLDISNDTTANCGVVGNNYYPNVTLDFKQGGTTLFTFTGKFTDENTVAGQLTGQFTGDATLSRAAVQ